MLKIKPKFVLIAGVSALVLASCATRDYEICDTPDCGDKVTVEVTE